MDDSNQKPKKRNTHKGIFLLPNLFTTAALFGGFYAIIAAMKGQFEIAAIAIFISMILDGLDGRVARLTNTESDFGAEYDSLADMVSFGVAPSLVMYQWSLHYLVDDSILLGKLGWLGAFVYTTCTALRLARFNTQVGTADKRYFQGLASPAAVAVLIIMLIFVFLSIEQATVLFSLFFLYMLSGPIVSLFRWNRNRLRKTSVSDSV